MSGNRDQKYFSVKSESEQLKISISYEHWAALPQDLDSITRVIHTSVTLHPQRIRHPLLARHKVYKHADKITIHIK